MTLGKKKKNGHREAIEKREFIFPAVKGMPDAHKRFLDRAERELGKFDALDRDGKITKNMHLQIFKLYDSLQALDIYEDKSINERVKRTIAKAERFMRKYDIKGTYLGNITAEKRDENFDPMRELREIGATRTWEERLRDGE
jgi:hypothetical protein